ncbi:MAG: PqqD family protein [Actinomycetota bacterium]|nr:PqqD family protein [Actinomycetota bacterium]
MNLKIRGERLVWRELDDEIIALDMRSSNYLRLNASGAVLWKLLSAGTTKQQLVAALTTSYGVPAEDASSDVDTFLEQLWNNALVEDA